MPASRILDVAQRIAGLERVPGLSDADLVAAVQIVGELRRLTDALGIELTAQLDRRCDPGGPDAPDRIRGHLGAAALVAAEAGIERVEAAGWRAAGIATAERTGITGEALPPVRPVLAEALTSGTISAGTASRIARTLGEVADRATPEQLDAFEATLVGVAPQISSRELRGLCRRVVDVIDPDGAEPREDDLRRRSSVTIQQLDSGLTRVVALVHPEGAAVLTEAIDARTARTRVPVFGPESSELEPPGTDRRPLSSRRVDALIGIARDSLANDDGRVAGAPVTVMVTVSLDALTSGLGTARIAGIDQPISAATARRMASDAEIIPVVLGSASENLDQGRRFRLATIAQRRELARRDRGCLWEGCDAPPGWCEVAHLLAWFLGGPTDLPNLGLLCPFHHHVFDSQGWSAIWIGGALHFIPPAHVDVTRTPRRVGPPRTPRLSLRLTPRA